MDFFFAVLLSKWYYHKIGYHKKMILWFKELQKAELSKKYKIVDILNSIF